MEGREFFEVAEVLRSSERQAFHRTSVGRSYYAAFLEARSFCERYLGFSRSASRGEHQGVARLLADVDPAVADTLRFLRIARNSADYDLDVSAATMIELSRDVLDAAQRIVRALDAHAERLERERPDPFADDGAGEGRG